MRRWLGKNGRTVGEIVGLEVVWRLAKGWYADPRRPDWRARTRDESQAVIAAAGLGGEFWELPR